MQIGYLDGPRLRRSLIAACEYAQRQRAELNRINVFPVPDGDTGTNLAMTVRAVADHLRANQERSVAAVAHEAAQGALLGARGNCGMMLSHFLLGFAESVSDRARITTGEFGSALRAGVDKLYASLEDPVEGTILTVMRDTAVAAQGADEADFVPLVTHVVAQARDSLARTPEQLEVLKKAGVVDAGAKGFVSMLEGVLFFVEGVSLAGDSEVGSGNGRGADSAADAAGMAAALADFSDTEEQYRFCTEALVRGGELPTQQAAQAVLREYGDSLIVIRSGDVLKVHVHTDEPEEVFAYLRGIGTLATHKAEDMKVQHETIGRSGGHVRLARRPVGIVTDSAADLPEEVVRAHGIQVVPLSLVDGDDVFRDGIDITATEFHDKLANADTLPTTSQPTTAALLEGFAAAADEAERVVGVFLSSTLSGTIHSAEAAAGRFEQAPLRLVDSLGASLLTGLLVLKGAELAEAGRSADEIGSELERIRARSGILFTVRTFDRMIASGRVGRGKAFIGRSLGLKPIMGMTPDGAVVPFGKAFGVQRARGEMLRVLRQRIQAGAEKIRFGVVHVGMPDIVDEMAAALRAEYGRDVEVLGAPATPVIATHLGIGAWGIAYMVED
jgi:DegV family protein with EDD domain